MQNKTFTDLWVEPPILFLDLGKEFLCLKLKTMVVGLRQNTAISFETLIIGFLWLIMYLEWGLLRLCQGPYGSIVIYIWWFVCISFILVSPLQLWNVNSINTRAWNCLMLFLNKKNLLINLIWYRVDLFAFMVL